VNVFLAAVDTLGALHAALRGLGMKEEQLAAIQTPPMACWTLIWAICPSKICPSSRVFLSARCKSTTLPLRPFPARRRAHPKAHDPEHENRQPGTAAGAPLEFLEARQSPIADLSPLADCQTLRALRIARTQVSDLTAVSTWPITAAHRDTKIADVSPLAACETWK